MSRISGFIHDIAHIACPIQPKHKSLKKAGHNVVVWIGSSNGPQCGIMNVLPDNQIGQAQISLMWVFLGGVKIAVAGFIEI
jgi:hypothetical protein